MKKRLIFLLSFVLVFAACAPEKQTTKGICLYYINAEGNELEEEEFNITTEDPSVAAEQLVTELQKTTEYPEGGRSILQNDISIASCRVNDKTVEVDLAGDYGSLVSAYKLLLTAGLTKTFVQIEGVDSVHITIQGEELLDSQGRTLGTLAADDFVIHSGKEINTYSSQMMTLYYLDENGNLAEEARNVYFRTSVPMEQVVVEELSKGPADPSHVAALPSELTFINVATQENICYVNFDENLFTRIQGYDIGKALKTIVQSLYSVCGVEKVQFSVNGDTAVVIDGVSLDQIFEAEQY